MDNLKIKHMKPGDIVQHTDLPQVGLVLNVTEDSARVHWYMGGYSDDYPLHDLSIIFSYDHSGEAHPGPSLPTAYQVAKIIEQEHDNKSGLKSWSMAAAHRILSKITYLNK